MTRRDHGDAHVLCDASGQIFWTGAKCTPDITKAKIYGSRETADITASNLPEIKLTPRRVVMTLAD